MNRVDLKLHDYRYFPYELRFAELEVERIFRAEPERLNGSLRVETKKRVAPKVLDRLTYFRRVTVAGKPAVIPQQARLEASATKHGNPSQLRRQCTRYSAHGLHEYRGKFNPQMVRTVMNILGLNVRDRVWDPFCGSGTVLLEARHQGFDAVGVDLNPLAVAISNAKLSAVDASPGSLENAAQMVAKRVQTKGMWISKSIPDEDALAKRLGRNWLERFPCPDYLVRWFPLPVLAQLLVIVDSIDQVVPPCLREVFRVILSDILREVSWQDPRDLRVRRRGSPAANYPAIEAFITALHSRVNSVLAAQRHISARRGWQSAFLGDSGDLQSLDGSAIEFLEKGVSCVLSSPPYATALPYIDTQRLSIALFGLATTQEIRELDGALVGSREISTRDRRALEESIECNHANVAEEVWVLCKALKEAYDPDRDGFRRQNTPAVIYRYFAGMTQVMKMAKRHLRRRGWLAFIVGPNRTSLGGIKILIDTPGLLATTGSHVGLQLRDMYELDAYRRFSVHSRNSIREERLLVMQRP